LLGLVQFPALVIGSVAGGTMSDAFDRRRIMMISQILLASTTAGLVVNASLEQPTVLAVFILTAANALVSGVDSPSRSASIPRLLDGHLLAPAYALQTVVFSVAAAVGPAAAGILISQVGVGPVYLIDSLTFGAALLALAMMDPILPFEGGTRAGLKSLLEGLRFVKFNPVLKGVFLIDISAMVLGSPRALFPEFGTSVLGGGEATVGYLFAAPGVGAAIAGLTSGWVGRVRRAGVATTIAVTVWGLGIMTFGLTTSLAVALIGLGVAGAGDSISAIFRSTMLQLSTPDRLRGRLSAVHIAVVTGGPRVGDAEAGLVAAGFGPRTAAWTGGFGSILAALVITSVLPAFRTWRLPDKPPPS